MTWTGWRGTLGGSATMLLLAVTTPIALAQTAALTSPAVTTPKSAKPVAAAPAKPAKSPVTKAAAKKSDTTHPAKRLAAAKPKPPATKLAAAPKKPASGKAVAVAAKKQAPSVKLASNAAKPRRAASAVAAAHDHVSYASMQVASVTPAATAATPNRAIAATPARLTPPAASTASPTAQIAATTASLTLPAETAAQSEKMTPPAKTATSSAAAPRPIETATPTVGPAASPPDPGSAPVFVSDFLREAFRIAKADGKSPLQRRAELADLFAGRMDMKFIAGYTTADELAGASADVQQRFRAILVNYLVETYYPRVELAADPSITVDVAPAPPFADGTSVVWTTFTKKGWGSQSIKWRLAAENGDFKIVDILSAGASLVQMERDTFRSVMRNGGLKELMAQLDARTKQLASAD